MANACTHLLVNRDSIRRLYNVRADLPIDKPRKLLDPLRFGARLPPNLALLKTLPEGYRYELIGARIGAFAHSIKPGSTSAGVGQPVPHHSNMFRLMRSVAQSRKPVAQTAAYEVTPGLTRRCFSMVLPLSMDGSTVNDLLLGLWPIPASAEISVNAQSESLTSVPDLVEELDHLRPAS